MVIKRCPPTTTEMDVRQKFKNAERVNMVMANGKFTRTCLVLFPTIAEAETAVKTTDLKFQGQAVDVKLAGLSCLASYLHNDKGKDVAYTLCRKKSENWKSYGQQNKVL